MDQHVYGNSGRPVTSRLAVARSGLAAMCTTGAALWVAVGGSTFDGRHLVGFLAAVLATGVFFVRLVDRATSYYLGRLEDDPGHLEDTGTWLDPTGYQELFTMRLDPDHGRIYVRGYLGEFGTYDKGVEVCTIAVARSVVQELELTGFFVPADDAGTASVRARLSLC